MWVVPSGARGGRPTADGAMGLREGGRTQGGAPHRWGRVQAAHRLRWHAALAHHSTSAHRSLGSTALHCTRVRELDSRSESTNRSVIRWKWQRTCCHNITRPRASVYAASARCNLLLEMQPVLQRVTLPEPPKLGAGAACRCPRRPIFTRNATAFGGSRIANPSLVHVLVEQ